jgi:hypothetical protein
LNLPKEYRTVYPLAINNTIKKQCDGALISYFDGSAEFHEMSQSAGRWNEHQTIPDRIVWHWKTELGKVLNTRIAFDEEEIFAAFRKLHDESPQSPITLLSEVVPASYSVSVILNEDSFVELKNIQIATFEP